MANDTVIMTMASRPKRVRQVNYTTNGYPTRIPTLTKPTIADTGSATAQVAYEATGPDGGGRIANGIKLLPFGVGANNVTFSLRVIGWEFTIDSIGSSLTVPVWVPVPLIEVACTVSSTPVGVASGYLTATDAFADTIAITGATGNQGVNCDVNSPANDTIASVYVDLKGCLMWEVIFTTGGSATSCNALYKLY